MKLINKYLKVTYITCAGEYKSFIGCPQGSALSPLFANIILTEVDNEFTRRRYAFVRYADDIVVLYKSERATREGIHKIISFIRKCGLEINPDKVEIGNIKNGVNFLGFHIYMNNMIHVVPATGRYQRIKEKIRNIINNDNLDNMQWGTIMEPIIRNHFAEVTGKTVVELKAMLQHPEHPFMLADVDGVTVDDSGNPAILEIKTASEFKRSDWDEGVPAYYQTQVQHYLCVAGIQKAYIAVLIGGNSFRIFEVDADEEIQDMLIAVEK